MIALKLVGVAGFLVGLGVTSGLEPVPAVLGQPAPQHVTTDSVDYCMRLLDRLGDIVRGTGATPSATVIELSADGQLMCERGQARAGILRLRHALVLMAAQEP